MPFHAAEPLFCLQNNLVKTLSPCVLHIIAPVLFFKATPFRAVTYATQKIIRQSNVTERSLVTTCRLLNSSRSDDNPNGFTIEGFTIIENKDLQTIKR